MNIVTNSNSKLASRAIYLGGMSEPCLAENNEGVYVGRSNIYKIPYFLDLDMLLNKNIAILGMSGSGKSYFLKSFIIRSALQRKSSVLIIDWNNEYNDTISFIGGKTLVVGRSLRINIFDMYDLKNLKNIRNISDTIGYSLNLNDEENYAIYNSILFLSSNKTLHEMNLSYLINQLSKGNGELSKRLSRKLLQLKEHPMFADMTNFSFKELLSGVVNIDFSMLRDDVQRSEISKSVLSVIIELMHRIDIGTSNKRPEKMIVLDEAWRLIKNSEDVGVLFREGRKYGFCVIVATQLVNDINNEVLSNAACLVLFRLQNDNDYRLLLDSGVITEREKRRISHLPVGSCLFAIALKDGNNKVSKFFIGSTDGISTQFYNIKSGKMQNRISNKSFLEATKKLQVDNKTKELIVNFLNQNNNEIDDIRLVDFMIGLNVKRYEIFYYLRLLGLKDVEIVKALDGRLVPSITEVSI
jgi:hypothetical protein